MHDLARLFHSHVFQKKKKTVKALDLIIFLSEKCGNFVDSVEEVFIGDKRSSGRHFTGYKTLFRNERRDKAPSYRCVTLR